MSNENNTFPGAESLDERQGPQAPGTDFSADRARELRIQNARREITERRRITSRLRQALAADGFVLHFQPQVDLLNGRPRGAEAVIRLRHRRRGLILPNHFIPVAERTDIMHDIGGWILDHACMEAARWPEELLVAVSLSARQLRNGKLVKFLIESLSRSGLAPERLELELTEAMLIDDNEDTLFSLRAVQGLGVRMAIHNFGVGYASLSALRRLPLSTLKLDRSLVQGFMAEDENAGIIHAAIDAGHALGCTVLADGVETEAQCRALARIGCDDGQGAYFGPPAEADAFLGRMKR
jgi:EAL domain-containing protein (putative c-di-GMP-specific phosphodiesterase class I)